MNDTIWQRKVHETAKRCYFKRTITDHFNAFFIVQHELVAFIPFCLLSRSSFSSFDVCFKITPNYFLVLIHVDLMAFLIYSKNCIRISFCNDSKLIDSYFLLSVHAWNRKTYMNSVERLNFLLPFFPKSSKIKSNRVFKNDAVCVSFKFVVDDGILQSCRSGIRNSFFCWLRHIQRIFYTVF